MGRRWTMTTEWAAGIVAAHWALPPVRVEWLGAGAEGDVVLLEADDGRRWAAKLSYQRQDWVEEVMQVAAALDAAGLAASAPVPAADGSLVVMAEGPPGYQHPFTVTRFVVGRPLDMGSPGAAVRLARVTALVHRVATEVMADRTDRSLDYLAAPFEVPAGVAWLPRAIDVLVDAALRVAPSLTHAVAPWEGPEILVDDDGVEGVVDLGVVGWRPVSFHLANQLLSLSRNGTVHSAATAPFLAEYRRTCPLTDADVAALPLFARCCQAIYAKFDVGQLPEDGTQADEDEALASVRRLRPFIEGRG